MQQAEVGTTDHGGGAGREESGRSVGTMEKGRLGYEGKPKTLIQRRKEDVGTKEKRRRWCEGKRKTLVQKKMETEDVGTMEDGNGRRWYHGRWKKTLVQ